MGFSNLSQTEIDALLNGDLGESEPQEQLPTESVGFEKREEKAKAPNISQATFQELEATDRQMSNPVAGMEVLMDVPLSISVELGKARCYVKDLLNLTVGSVVELDRTAGDPVDILINGRPFAYGEVVVIDENFGVRLRQIIHKKD